MSGLGSSFHYEEINYTIAESMEEYALDSTEAAYEYPREKASMRFMAAGGGFNDGNVSHWWYRKHSSFPRYTCSNNTN